MADFGKNALIPRTNCEGYGRSLEQIHAIQLLHRLVINGCSRKKKKQLIWSILGFSVSAILHKYDAVLGELWKTFHLLSLHSALCCTESCLAEMQTCRPPVGVCDDCVVLLLHWTLGSAEWAEGRKQSEGDDPRASCCHTSNTGGKGKKWILPK